MLAFYLLVLALVLAITFDSVKERVGVGETTPYSPRREMVERVTITYPVKNTHASAPYKTREQIREEHEQRMKALRKEYKEWRLNQKEYDRVRSKLSIKSEGEKHIGRVVNFEDWNNKQKQYATS